MKVKVGRGFEMEATAKKFAPKNWLYLNFTDGSRICFDLNTGDIVKGQSYRMPVLCPGERERIIAEYK